jgi:hypothetical protein
VEDLSHLEIHMNAKDVIFEAIKAQKPGLSLGIEPFAVR